MYNAYIIAGGTGFVGTALVQKLLQQNKRVYVLTRQQKKSERALLSFVQWDTDAQTISEKIIDENTCVINLAGANVAEGRWTEARKKEILQSRTQSAETLHKLISTNQIHCSFYFGASAIGYYGSATALCDEKMPASTDFLGATCKAWEEANEPIAQSNIPVSIGRIGLVIGNEGGALPELMNSFQFRIAAVPGNGKQIYSWIHLQDLCDAIIHLCNNKINGVHNLVATTPTSAKEFIGAIAKAINKFTISLPIPQLALKIVLGEFSIELLKSVAVSNKKLLASGFKFTHENISSCMNNLLGKK
jgi:uncharacterized protein